MCENIVRPDDNVAHVHCMPDN